DNLPNTGLEALSCGTPIAAFKVGGLEDIVRHRVNGYLAAPFSPEDLATGMSWLLSDSERRTRLSYMAAADARTNFSAAVVAKEHIRIYSKLLDEAN
ncbi:MAG: glycosyltransferase, partial [Pseudomonadota bacterium]